MARRNHDAKQKYLGCKKGEANPIKGLATPKNPVQDGTIFKIWRRLLDPEQLLQQLPKILQQPMKTEVRSRFTLRLMIGYFNTHNNFQKYYMC